MEIKFQSRALRSLCRTADRQQLQEQTQEVRLPDSMPDIGRVLGCWGQILVRGKEWRGSAMTVSGGVMAWVLYVPEDGSEPRSVETWIPFQMKWDLADSQQDGYIFAVPGLKAMDARSTSARKLMVRANICLRGMGLEAADTQYYSPDEMPEDVNLLTADYPMELMCESGEKLVPLEEELTLPSECPNPQKLLRYDLNAAVTEQKVLASRLVFRGKGNIHLMYLADGRVCCADCEISFSQYADLDREYGAGATAQVVPILTNLELELMEGRLRLKGDLAAQYIICDRVMVQLVEDAYSNCRPIGLQNCQLQLERRLDRRKEALQLEETVNVSAERIADVSCCCELPQRQQSTDVTQLVLPGQVQVLYYDAAGNLHSGSTRFEKSIQIPADSDAVVEGFLFPTERFRAIATEQQVQVSGGFALETVTVSGDVLWMVNGLELGELTQPDPGRPSLILRRFTDARLWDAAKDCGSTVEAIRSANDLQGEPEQGRILLIPVS